VLVATLTPELEGVVNFHLRLYPAGGATLPGGVHLGILDQARQGVEGLTTVSQAGDDWLQLQLLGSGGDRFGVKVSLEGTEVVESFTIHPRIHTRMGNRMAKLVVLEMGAGSFATGLTVMLRVSNDGEPCTIALDGQLPPAPAVLSCYQSWQFSYRSRGKGFRQIQAVPGVDRQQSNLKVLASELVRSLNEWLNSGDRAFRKIRDQLLKTISTNQPVRLMIQTDQPDLWQLPWELWDLVQDHPNVGLALSKREFAAVPPSQPHAKVRILALLGNSTDLNIQRDLELLQQHLPPEAEIVAPKQVERSRLSDELWTQPWDILFFAGHSSSRAGEGKFYLTADRYLMIDDLKYALNQAIAHGLKLAIFNSCDGLELARDLADLQLPATIVMREKIPDEAAQQFIGYFLQGFAQEGRSLSASVRYARQRLHDWEEKYPCVSWLPAVCQNPTAPELEWRSFLPAPIPKPTRPRRSQRLKWQSILAISLVVTGWVMGMRSLGWLEAAELWSYDRLLQWQPNLGLDAKILIVGVTDADVQAFGKPLKDRTVYELLSKLEPAEPKVIGLDILRDQPTEPGWKDLTQFLQQSQRTIVPCTVGGINGELAVAPPPKISAERLGYIDGLMQDPDSLIRRYSLRMDSRPQSACQSKESLGLQVLSRYLDAELGYIERDRLLVLRTARYPTVEIPALSNGNYQRPAIQMTGHQILIHYNNGGLIAEQLSLTEVRTMSLEELQRKVRGKMILIGYVGGKTSGDIHATPVGKLPGVLIHAQVISQLQRRITEYRSLPSPLPESATFLWIFLWTIGSVWLQLHWRRRIDWRTIVLVSLLLFAIGVICFGFTALWLPVIPATLGLIQSSLLTVGWLNQTVLIQKMRSIWHRLSSSLRLR
jgi:CHASE2 domain-containing sensor protein